MAEQDFERAKQLIARAALSLCSWEEAVSAIAAATNSRTGQLIGLAMPNGLRFNIMTGIDPAALVEFAQVGGGDPAINSRVRVGVSFPELRWFGDGELTPEQDAARSPAFADWIGRNRLGACQLVTLLRQDGGVVGAGVVRDSAQDSYNSAELAMLEELGSALRHAVLARMAIEGDQAALVAGSFEQIGRPVFVCGPDGLILALSPRAARLLDEQRWFASRKGCLVPANSVFARDFATLVSRLCLGQSAAGADDALVVRDSGGTPLLVRVHRFSDVDP